MFRLGSDSANFQWKCSVKKILFSFTFIAWSFWFLWQPELSWQSNYVCMCVKKQLAVWLIWSNDFLQSFTRRIEHHTCNKQAVTNTGSNHSDINWGKPLKLCPPLFGFRHIKTEWLSGTGRPQLDAVYGIIFHIISDLNLVDGWRQRLTKNTSWSICTFNHSEHRVRLVQRDGETQSLQVLLLLQQVGQLLLPSHAQETHKHIFILHTSSSNCNVWTLDASAHC